MITLPLICTFITHSTPLRPASTFNHVIVKSPAQSSRTRRGRFLPRSPPTSVLNNSKQQADFPSVEFDISNETNYLTTPRHWRVPIIGFLIDLLLLRLELPSLAVKYGSVYATDTLGDRTVVITDLSTIGVILRDSKSFLSGSNAFLYTVRKMFGDRALLFCDGQQHTQKRMTIRPSLAANQAKSFFDVGLHSAFHLWSDIAHQLTCNTHIEVDPLVNSHFLRIIQTITNNNSDNAIKKNVYFATLFKRLLNGMATIPIGSQWNDALNARIELVNEIGMLIKERISIDSDKLSILREGERADKFNHNVDLLDTLISSSSISLRVDQIETDDLKWICETIIEIWISGYATQTTAVLFSIAQLSLLSSETHEKLVSEQTNYPTLNYGNVTSGMPLLSSFITETMRMYPPVFSWPRVAACDARVLGHRIRKGDHISLDLLSAHRNEKYFENATVFNAWRFVNQSTREEEKHLLSFGAPGGAHYCLGASLAKVNIKTCLAVMLRDFDLDWKVHARGEFDGLEKEVKVSILPAFRPYGGVIATRCERKTKRIK